MSEYNMTHTGKELDDAINKVKSGYILPDETINITENVSNKDITNGKVLNVNVPVPDNYIDKTKISHFATGVVNNVTSGQALSVTGIKDEKTGETFQVKGVLAHIQPTANTWLYPPNHAAAKPAAFCFVKDTSKPFGAVMCCGAQSQNVSYIREVRFNTDMAGVSSSTNATITMNGNSFTFISRPDDMYGLLAASQWRWVAWG